MRWFVADYRRDLQLGIQTREKHALRTRNAMGKR